MYKHFNIEEFNCSETGENKMSPDFLAALDKLRGICDFPFVINSGYRSPKHSLEALKDKPGTHTKGIAADISVTNSSNRFDLIDNAIQHGFSGIGIDLSYIHLDMRSSAEVMWVY
jgi:uncharacterized protein YcbK (DUF882 family)